jgi:hypothetical protein
VSHGPARRGARDELKVFSPSTLRKEACPGTRVRDGDRLVRSWPGAAQTRYALADRIGLLNPPRRFQSDRAICYKQTITSIYESKLSTYFWL